MCGKPSTHFISRANKISYRRETFSICPYTRGSHHIYKDLNHRISIPERKELGKGLLRKILQEAGIDEDEFVKYW